MVCHYAYSAAGSASHSTNQRFNRHRESVSLIGTDKKQTVLHSSPIPRQAARDDHPGIARRRSDDHVYNLSYHAIEFVGDCSVTKNRLSQETRWQRNRSIFW